jgi:predicted nucleic acid-binding protein
VILVDSNIPMYLVGASHPHKSDAQRLLEKLVSERQRLVTDAEVLQEILHRYVAINRRDAIQPASTPCFVLSIRFCPWIALSPNVRKKLSWGIGTCLLVTPCISRSWNSMESIAS